MLHQLATRLRERRGGDGEGEGATGEEGAVILDDNCEVRQTSSILLFLVYVFQS